MAFSISLIGGSAHHVDFNTATIKPSAQVTREEISPAEIGKEMRGRDD